MAYPLHISTLQDHSDTGIEDGERYHADMLTGKQWLNMKMNIDKHVLHSGLSMKQREHRKYFSTRFEQRTTCLLLPPVARHFNPRIEKLRRQTATRSSTQRTRLLIFDVETVPTSPCRLFNITCRFSPGIPVSFRYSRRIGARQ